MLTAHIKRPEVWVALLCGLALVLNCYPVLRILSIREVPLRDNPYITYWDIGCGLLISVLGAGVIHTDPTSRARLPVLMWAGLSLCLFTLLVSTAVAVHLPGSFRYELQEQSGKLGLIVGVVGVTVLDTHCYGRIARVVSLVAVIGFFAIVTAPYLMVFSRG